MCIGNKRAVLKKNRGQRRRQYKLYTIKPCIKDRPQVRDLCSQIRDFYINERSSTICV